MLQVKVPLRPYVLRYCGMVVFIACISAAIFYSSKVASATGQPAQATASVPAKVGSTAATPEAINDAALRERLNVLEEKDRQNQILILESERKSIDWWFSYLAIFTAFLALGGIFVPFILTKKDKEQLTELLHHAQNTADKINAHEQRANESADHIEEKEEQLNARMNKWDMQGKVTQDDSPASQSQREDVSNALAEVQATPGMSLSTQLRAKAIAAITEENYSQAEAYWRALLAELPQDAQANFGLGVTLQMQANACKDNALADAVSLWREAGKYYAQALRIKPDMHEAAYNWGSALDDEAQALIPTDLTAARICWAQAELRYQQALNIKPDKYEAANNWGYALAAEAQALAHTDLATARACWAQAGQRYQQALIIKPDMYEAACNWGSALAGEAQVLLATDLIAARDCCVQAGLHFQQALNIKPDMYEAANNWGLVLIYLYVFLLPNDPENAEMVLAQAGEKCLLAEKIKPGAGAYNLACIAALRGEVTECLKWLSVCQDRQTLPDKAHIKADSSFDQVRATPEFTAWWRATFGE